jgi:hypothetical protein
MDIPDLKGLSSKILISFFYGFMDSTRPEYESLLAVNLLRPPRF